MTKVTYLGPAEVIDVGKGFETVPKGGLEVDLTDAQLKSMKAVGHRFEGHETRDAERARPNPIALNRDPKAFEKQLAESAEQRPVDVGAGLGITAGGDSGADVTNAGDTTTTSRSRSR